MNDTIKHFYTDTYPIKFYEDTPEGFLNFIAPIAKAGKMQYLDSKNGTIYDENISANTLVKSAKTFRCKPITSPHPKKKLDSNNYAQHIKGSVGNREYFQQDTGLLWFSGSVFDADTIDRIKSGETKELSSGYDGYVAIRKDGSREQIDRVGNHVSVVAKGRAGIDVSFKVDTDVGEIDEYIWILKEDSNLLIPDPPTAIIETIHDSGKTFHDMKPGIINKPNNTGKKMPKQILIGKAIFTVDGDDAIPLAEAVGTLQEQLETLLTETATEQVKAAETQTKLDAANTELATIKGQLTAKETQLTEVQTKLDSSEDIAEEIKLRLDCWANVEPFVVKVQPGFKRDEHLGLSVPAIKRLYLNARYPQMKTAFDGYDLNDPIKVAELNGMYAASIASQSKATEPTHTDAMLQLVTTDDSYSYRQYGDGSKPGNSTRHDSAEPVVLDSDPMKISREDAQLNLEQRRKMLRERIEGNSKKNKKKYTAEA